MINTVGIFEISHLAHFNKLQDASVDQIKAKAISIWQQHSGQATQKNMDLNTQYQGPGKQEAEAWGTRHRD
jgi:hypothetical protein